MLCLNIRRQYAQLDMHSPAAEINLNTSMSKLDMTSEAAVLEISREKGELEIDNDPCRYSIGLKNNSDLARDLAADGMQALKDFIVRIVEMGSGLEAGKGDSPVISDIMFNRLVKPMMGGVTLKYIESPKISYTPDKMTMSFKPKTVTTSYQPAKVENNTRTEQVSIRMIKQPSLTMWLTEGKFDIYA